MTPYQKRAAHCCFEGTGGSCISSVVVNPADNPGMACRSPGGAKPMLARANKLSCSCLTLHGVSGDTEPAVAGSCGWAWRFDGGGICKGICIGQGTDAGCPAHVWGRLCLRGKQPQELMMAVGACLMMTDLTDSSSAGSLQSWTGRPAVLERARCVEVLASGIVHMRGSRKHGAMLESIVCKMYHMEQFCGHPRLGRVWPWSSVHLMPVGTCTLILIVDVLSRQHRGYQTSTPLSCF